jgi:hypothetical protein
MRARVAPQLLDGNDMNLPQVSPRSFWLQGTSWEVPTFENAEAFVARLAKSDVIARDARIAAALEGDPRELSDRSIQRRFLSVCGMSHSTMRQIERARPRQGSSCVAYRSARPSSRRVSTINRISPDP